MSAPTHRSADSVTPSRLASAEAIGQTSLRGIIEFVALTGSVCTAPSADDGARRPAPIKPGALGILPSGAVVVRAIRGVMRTLAWIEERRQDAASSWIRYMPHGAAFSSAPSGRRYSE